MAIEASKFTEKDELIAKFYTLRAGLSVIAEETDKIKQAEQELSILNTKNEEHNKKIQNDFISDSDYYKKQIAGLQHPSESNPTSSYLIQKRINGHQKELEKIKEHKAAFSHTILPWFITMFLGWFIGFGLMTATGSNTLGILIGLICIYILPFIVGSKWRKRITEQQQATMRAPIQEKIKQETLELKKAKDVEEQAMSTLTAEFAALELSTKTKTDIYKGEIEAFETTLTTEIIPTCTSIALSVKTAMLQTSMGVITEADWANIDLLIFYLETGRADSLKEALQLVDKQRQTDQITYAIHEASSHIVNTLGERLNRLGGIIQAGFTGLAKQIQFNHNEAMSTMQHAFSSLEYSINAGNQEMSKKLSNIQASIKAEGERIANAEQLNASLLKKANESSDKLMYELRYNQKYWKK